MQVNYVGDLMSLFAASPTECELGENLYKFLTFENNRNKNTQQKEVEINTEDFHNFVHFGIFSQHKMLHYNINTNINTNINSNINNNNQHQPQFPTPYLNFLYYLLSQPISNSPMIKLINVGVSQHEDFFADGHVGLRQWFIKQNCDHPELILPIRDDNVYIFRCGVSKVKYVKDYISLGDVLFQLYYLYCVEDLREIKSLRKISDDDDSQFMSETFEVVFWPENDKKKLYERLKIKKHY